MCQERFLYDISFHNHNSTCKTLPGIYLHLNKMGCIIYCSKGDLNLTPCVTKGSLRGCLKGRLNIGCWPCSLGERLKKAGDCSRLHAAKKGSKSMVGYLNAL